MRTQSRAYVLTVAATVRSRTACSDEQEVGLNARRPMSPPRDFTVAATLDSQRGIALVDCLAYIGLLAVILTMAFAAFYRALERSRDLSRNAAGIVRALQAGERWRADVRASARPPQLETIGEESRLRLASGAGEVTYTFRAGGVLRQALPNTNWVEFLPRAASSRMFEERRQRVAVWHWDVELKGGQKVARSLPLFSFQAVARSARRP